MVVNSMSYATYDSYKDSGVDWLGKIPSDWDLLKVKNIFRLVMKFAPKNNDCELLSVYTDIGVKPRKELEERGNRATTTDGYLIVEKGDIVVNKLLAWMGAIGLSDYDGVTSPAYDVLKPKMPIEGIFYHLLFRSPQCTSELKRHSRGIMDMRLRLYFDKFGDVVVPYPNIEVQKKIVSFLAEKTAQIDQAIALKQQQIEKLNEYKQIVIQNAVTKGLNPNAPMKNSGVEWIGDIPEHWKVISLRYLFNFLNYRRIPISAELRGNIQGIYPYYGASGIIDYIDKYIFDEKLILIAEDGANLLSKSTPLAFIAEGKYWVNNHAHILKPKHEGFEYWAELLSCCDYTKYISGSAQPKLSRENLGSVRLVLPYREEILEISKLINQIKPRYDDAISKHEAQIDRLKEYKNILINQAVTGKLKIY